MQNDIRVFVLSLLEKKIKLPNNFDDSTDFIQAGIVDSMSIIKFILELESKFDIEITDANVESNDFRSVKGLVNMISRKIST